MKCHTQRVFSWGVAIAASMLLSAAAGAVSFTTSPDPAAFIAFDDHHGNGHHGHDGHGGGHDHHRGHGHDRHGDAAPAAFVLAEFSPLGDSICLSDPACFDAGADALIFRISVDAGIFDTLAVVVPGLEPLGVGLFSGDGVPAVSAHLDGSLAHFDFGAGLEPGGPSAALFMTFAAGSLTGDETIGMLLANHETRGHRHHGRHHGNDDDSDSDSDSDSDRFGGHHDDWFDDFTRHHGHGKSGHHRHRHGFDDVMIAAVGLQAVPEPGSLVLMVVGLLAAVATRRR